MLRAAFAGLGGLDAVTRKAIIDTKRNVGYRLTLRPEEVRVF